MTWHGDASRARADRRLADLTDLIDHGETPARAIRRLYPSITAAERAALRAGRTDLAVTIRATEYRRTA